MINGAITIIDTDANNASNAIGMPVFFAELIPSLNEYENFRQLNGYIAWVNGVNNESTAFTIFSAAAYVPTIVGFVIKPKINTPLLLSTTAYNDAKKKSFPSFRILTTNSF